MARGPIHVRMRGGGCCEEAPAAALAPTVNRRRTDAPSRNQMCGQATSSAGADWDWPPVRRLFAGTGIGSGGRRPGLDGTGSWQCRPKAGTGTGLGLDFLLRTTSEGKNRRRILIFTHVSPLLSMEIG